MASKKQGAGFSLKDELFNKTKVQYLADLFSAADKSFNATSFVRDTMKRLKKLELKERVVHISRVLENYLEQDYRAAIKQITAALPPPLDPTKTDDDFGDFIIAPLGDFVVRNGLEKKHLKLSLKTLRLLTQRFSMEDSIRFFIDAHTDETLTELEKWAGDKNYHVRRLVSEGTRPLLPWSGRLSIDASTPIPFLDQLHIDQTRYVTRSVSNHLNDISKTQPKLVIDALKRWKKQGEQDAKELKWMSKHALRTLVKQGNSQALQFLGYRQNPKIEVSNFELKSTSIKPGQAIEFSFDVSATRGESLMVDYVIDFVKANGTTAPKVHKLKQLSLEKDETTTIKKRHPLRANATTYTLYPGTHHVTLQINGAPFGKQSFELK